MKKRRTSYVELINEIKNNALEEKVVYKAIDLLLTLDNRIEWADCFNSLTPYEKNLYAVLKKEETKFFDLEEKESRVFYVLLSPYNKVTFSFLKVANYFVVGKVLLSNEMKQFFLEEFRVYQEKIVQEEKMADSYFKTMDHSERLLFLNDLEKIFQTKNPITVLLNQKIYSNFYDWNNLYKKKAKEQKNFIFDALRENSYKIWEKEDKKFLYAMKLLIDSGTPIG